MFEQRCEVEPQTQWHEPPKLLGDLEQLVLNQDPSKATGHIWCHCQCCNYLYVGH